MPVQTVDEHPRQTVPAHLGHRHTILLRSITPAPPSYKVLPQSC